MRVLIIEDDEALARAMFMVLHACGHKVTHASAMLDAKKKVNFCDPEIVITDLGLPDSDGVETLKSIMRVIEDDIPIIVFSADSRRREGCLRMGADVFMSKGDFKPMDLPTAVHMAVNSKRLTQVLDRHEAASNGEISYPGQPVDDPGKIGDNLLNLAAEVKAVAGG